MKTDKVKQPELERIRKNVEDIKVAMISTTDTDGLLRSRPMQTLKFDADGCLWFFTHRQSHKLDEMQAHPEVNLSYADPDSQTYVSISGTAEQLDDKTMIEELWSPIVKAWFPEGKDDPQLTLLKVKITQAEYWDSSASKMVELFRIAKAVLTGTHYEGGEHGQVAAHS